MKRIALLSITIIIAVLASNSQAFANEDFMSLEEQSTYMKTTAKNIRKRFWQSGHEDVSSSVEFMTKANLDAHVKDMGDYEEALGSDEISDLYRCHYNSSCELYLVHVSASYYGGEGYSAHFTLLYTKSKKHFEISHIVYAE